MKQAMRELVPSDTEGTGRETEGHPREGDLGEGKRRTESAVVVASHRRSGPRRNATLSQTEPPKRAESGVWEAPLATEVHGASAISREPGQSGVPSSLPTSSSSLPVGVEATSSGDDDSPQRSSEQAEGERTQTARAKGLWQKEAAPPWGVRPEWQTAATTEDRRGG